MASFPVDTPATLIRQRDRTCLQGYLTAPIQENHVKKVANCLKWTKNDENICPNFRTDAIIESI